jgi:hypothetical protein
MEKVDDILNNLKKILDERNFLYGDTYKEIENINIKINDKKVERKDLLFIMITLKYLRLKNMFNNEKFDVVFIDNLNDLINYSILLLLEIKNK